MLKKSKKIGLISLLIAIMFILTGSINAFAKNVSSKSTNKNQVQAQKILSDIDNYQKDYFTIVKRNDVLLFFEDVPELNNDRKELKKLFANVKKKVKNKNYLKEYKQIEKKYSKCSCYDEETMDCINEFAQNHNKEIDTLLNTVYKEVQTKISPKDLKNLTKSENKWLKEVEEYEKTYNANEFGSLGTSTYYDYQTDMKSFRTLLLMLYL